MVSGTEAREKLTNKAKCIGQSDVLGATARDRGCYRGENSQHSGVAPNRRDCLVGGLLAASGYIQPDRNKEKGFPQRQEEVQ